MKKMIGLLLAAMLLFCVPTALAAEDTCIEHDNHEEAMRRTEHCPIHLEYGVTECIGERVILNSGFHTAADGTRCLAVGYGSRYIDLCPICRRVLFVTSALHECYLEHRDCGKGRQDTHGI